MESGDLMVQRSPHVNGDFSSPRTMREKKTSKGLEEDTWGKLTDHIVEIILARLPLLPLKTSKKVCKHWESLINTPEFDILHQKLSQPQPCFIYCGMNSIVPRKSEAFAFNYATNEWKTLPRLSFPPHNFGSLSSTFGVVSAVAGPEENKLKYKLNTSPSSSSSCGDSWLETPLMSVPRCTPIVGVMERTGSGGIGHTLVVAGGGPDFEPEHMSVEVFDSEAGAWEVYDDLPAEFSGSSSRFWTSGAVCDGKFYVSLIQSWSIYALDLSTKLWSSLQWTCPPGLLFHHLLAVEGVLMVAGLCDCSEDHSGDILRLWKIDPGTTELIEVGTMPKFMLEAFKKAPNEVAKITFLVNENLLYVYNPDNQGYPVIVGKVLPEVEEMEWRALPPLPAEGYRFDNIFAFCTTLSSSSSVDIH